MWETNDEKTKLARVVVNFDGVLDDAFKINISKQIVHLPQALQAEIKKIADVARKDSQKKYRKEARQRPPPTLPSSVTMGGGGGVRPTPSRPGDTPVHPPSGAPASLSVAVKDVKTDKFLWKLTRGMTGSLDLQVSEASPNLAALVKQIRGDQVAVAHLAAFLGSLDDAEVQKALLNDKVS